MHVITCQLHACSTCLPLMACLTDWQYHINIWIVLIQSCGHGLYWRDHKITNLRRSTDIAQEACCWHKWDTASSQRDAGTIYWKRNVAVFGSEIVLSRHDTLPMPSPQIQMLFSNCQYTSGIHLIPSASRSSSAILWRLTIILGSKQEGKLFWNDFLLSITVNTNI